MGIPDFFAVRRAVGVFSLTCFLAIAPYQLLIFCSHCAICYYTILFICIV